MASKLLTTLILLTFLATALPLIPTAKAALSYTFNDNVINSLSIEAQEIIMQPYEKAIKLQTGLQCTGAGVPVTQGKTYFLAITHNGGYFQISGSVTGIYWKSDLTINNAGNPEVVWSAGEQISPFQSASVWKFTAAQTETITSYCNGGAGYFANYASYGLVGAISHASGAHTLIFESVSTQSETGILSTQTQKNPAASKFSFTRLNAPELIAQTTAAMINWDVSEAVQSVTAVPSKGTYLNGVSHYLRTSCTTQQTGWFSISQELTHPWNVSKEIANFTFTFQPSNPSDIGSIVFDFITSTVSSTMPLGISGISRHIGGNPTSDTGAFIPSFSSGTYYLKSHYTGCAKLWGHNAYSGGTAYTNSGSSWTAKVEDFGNLNVHTYGGKQYTFQLNQTRGDVGGSVYTYIAEHQLDTITGKSKPVSSFGGSPIEFYSLAASQGTADCSFESLTYACSIKEYRLGYQNIPVDSAQSVSITLDTASSGRNILYSATLINQPSRLNIAPTLYDNQELSGNDFRAYYLLSNDNYYNQVTFTIKNCLSGLKDSICSGSSFPVGGLAYNGHINNARAFSGSTDSQGQFTLTGQDLQNATTTVTLSGTGYTTMDYTVKVPPGSAFYNVTLFVQESSEGSLIVTSQSIQVSPNPGNFTVPNPAYFHVNKTFDDIIYWSVFRLESSGLPSIRTQTYPFSSKTEQIRYPITGATNSGSGFNNHVGQYYLAITDYNGLPLKVVPFVICASNSTCLEQPTINSALNTTIQQSTQVAIQVAAKEINTPLEDSRGWLHKSVDWAHQSKILIPNMWWPPIIGLMVLVFMQRRDRY